MSIDFRCPNGHKLSVAVTLAGRKARCPLCKVKMLVPEDNALPKQVARAAPENAQESPAGTKFTGIQFLELAPSKVGRCTARAAAEMSISRPDGGKVQSARLLAVPLAMVAAFATAPVWMAHGDLWTAPAWAKGALLIAALQLAYVAWLAIMPDFSTAEVCLAAFACVSAVYALLFATALFTPLDTPLFFGLGESRQQAAAWCAAVFMLTAFMTFACGRLSGSWRRSCQLAMHRTQERTSTSRSL